MNIELKSLNCDDEAAEIVEAAVVLPLMFMILVGIYWFGMVFNIICHFSRCDIYSNPLSVVTFRRGVGR
jgi:hypothetical protein